MWACYNYNHDDFFYLLILICLIVFLAVNFLSFKLLSKIVDGKNKIALADKEFSRKTKECFDKIANSYNLVEAGRISLGIYHDLANILTSSNLALHDILSNTGNRFSLESLLRRAICINNRANDLIKSFKGQCQSGGKRYVFYLSEEIKKSLLILNYYFIKDNVELDLRIINNVKIFGDSVKFGQAIVNVISNALESFSDNSSLKKVFIKLETRGGEVFLSIKDTGVGISRDNLVNIFNPFFSLKINSGKEHCGIGLSLVRRIVENDFFGKISVKSDPGVGSEFIIILPIDCSG